MSLRAESRPNPFRTPMSLFRQAAVLLPALALFAASASAETTFDAAAFGALPAQAGGRVQPLDSLARNTLLLLRQKQTVSFTTSGALMMRNTSEGEFYTKKPSTWTEADKAAFRADGLPLDDKDVVAALEARPVAVKRSAMGDSLDADHWLAEVAFRPWIAAHFRVFRVDNEEVQSLLGLPSRNPAQYSWAEMEKGFPKLAEVSNLAGKKDPGVLTPFENGALKLASGVERYHMLSTATFVPGDLPPDIDPMREYWSWLGTLQSLSDRIAGTKSATSAGKLDPKQQEIFMSFRTRYVDFMKEGKVGLVPPRTPGEIKDTQWANFGGAMMDVLENQSLDKPPVFPRYAELAVAYRTGDDAGANTKVREIAAIYNDGVGGYSAAKVSGEVLFNKAEPFYRGVMIYALAGVAVLAGWIASRRRLLAAAYWLLAAGWIVHTGGLIARMWIQGRPPVTNLYSSAVFVGWGAVLLGHLVERFWKNGFGSMVAAIVGFGSLVIAHQLGANGEDTIEMMRAVLDSNFWLATHVVVVTAGYCAMFVAGCLAALCIVRRLADRRFDDAAEQAVSRAAYGALAFAAIASFVGTMLGGIWADQSWGRFWGWDPKENGALLIVLWCALVLHARLGGLVRRRGFLNLLVAGNIVTAWSWFGTNLLGVGLHSYGFTQAGATALKLFMLAQLVLIALGCLKGKKAASAPADPA